MKLYFLQFHPKINRIVKSYPDLQGYSSFIIQEIGALDATNFKYEDGISTSFVYNFSTSRMPDYAIIVNDAEEVTTRWYVSEIKYVRDGQYRVYFLRDVLADFKNEVLQATCLIEKATVSDNDPAIYNQEQTTFNMIKQRETLLKDRSQSAWLVGYLSTDNAAEKSYSAASSNQITYRVNGIQNWIFYKYINEDFIGAPRSLTYNVKIGKPWYQQSSAYFMTYAFNKNGAAATDTQNPLMGYTILKSGDYAYTSADVMFNSNHTDGGKTYTAAEIFFDLNAFLPNQGSYFDSLLIGQGDISTEDQEGAFTDLDGKIIFDSASSKTYRINVNLISSLATKRYMPEVNSALWLGIKTAIQQNSTTIFYAHQDANPNDKALYIKYNANSYRITLSEISTELVTSTITASRRILNDAPYTMFAIPYGSVSFKIGNDTYTSEPESSLALAREISIELFSSGALYDIQLLPYCPRQDLVDVDFIDLRSTVATEHADYELIVDNNSIVKSFILFCKESSFTFDIDEQILITEKKVQNQCDAWRLCSPNYNGVFEFNAVKNGGVDYFNVDCTYRPYNPYIHVNPNFKDLYGNDYDDARGLICSGDFSMPAVTEKWLEYEAQNKNYQSSFDRSIQHMEVQQKYERVNQIAGAVAGVGSGALGGGIFGGVPGAIAGGLASAAGAAADIVMGEQLRSEQIRYAKDQFAFNLENIRALPNTLAKISAFNKNNKIFPFLEHYSCTDIEREAFRNVLIYDGMTVNRIGRIIDFLRDGELQFVKARLIRSDELHDDQHIIDVITSEMEKGAYYDTRSD